MGSLERLRFKIKLSKRVWLLYQASNQTVCFLSKKLLRKPPAGPFGKNHFALQNGKVLYPKTAMENGMVLGFKSQA